MICPLRQVCVFCGSNPGRRPEYAQAARELGELLAARGVALVYGGGNTGIMGLLADAVIDRGGRVVGVIPEALAKRELAHGGLSELHVTRTMHERKALMAELADGFIGLPGGLGTFEEFLEILTWAQLGIHAKPCGLLNIAGYYDPLKAFLDHAVEELFVKPEHAAMLLLDSEPEALLQKMADYTPPTVEKWIDLDRT
jgi:uncharacterized protein (TIGR00730 family)